MLLPDIVFELEEINPELDSCDVAIVCGANDTVNPAAEEDPTSELAGMPVIQARSMRERVDSAGRFARVDEGRHWGGRDESIE